MDFEAKANSPKSPTREHLVPKKLGGTDELSNLVLCHRHCNAHLRDHPKAKKLEIQAKWHAEFAKQKARREARPHSQVPVLAHSRSGFAQTEVRWKQVAAACALVAAFACGLSTGLLIAA